MQKHNLYIVVTRTNTFLGKLIQFFKKDEYTHAAISLDKRLNHMYSFGRKYAFIPFIGVFKHEEVNTGLNKYQKEIPGVIIELEVTKEQYEKATALIAQFISNSKKYKYNYRGLYHGLFNREACSDYRFLCSEFVYYILKESGIIDFKLPRNLVRPQTFLDLEGRVIFKGNIKDIHPRGRGYQLLFLNNKRRIINM